MTDKKGASEQDKYKVPFEKQELDGAYKEPEDAKFKENVIQDMPEIRPQEFSKPISDRFGKHKKASKGEANRAKNKDIADRKKVTKRREKNKQAKKARKKNRRK